MPITNVSAISLENLLNLVRGGRFSLPGFQRGFAWSKKEIRELLESIDKGYPIGVIIALSAKHDFLAKRIDLESFLPSATNYDDYEGTYWIIDGYQRLAALYGTFSIESELFNLSYNLEERKIFYPENTFESATNVNIKILFDSNKMLQRLKEIEAINSTLVDELISLSIRFRNYSLPLQIIKDADMASLSQIFYSLNNSGSSLTQEEIQNAARFLNEEDS